MHRIFLSVVLLLQFSVINFGQSKLLSPDEFLPHKLGEQFTEHHMLVNYFHHVDENSERVKLVRFGETNQKRPMLLAIVSSPEIVGPIEQYRLSHLRKAGLDSGQIYIDEPVAVVWLGFSVHGNEAAGSEASMAVLHELANPANKEIQQWLKNTIVIIEPSGNPDGYARYTNWYRSVSPALPDPDPDALEHREPWPGGRVNHYFFDLNRDWAWGTQIETQNRVRMYQQWMPHVVADIHEQGYTSPYYFAPAAKPYHSFITKWQADFQTEVGKNNAKYFDKNGWLYFTKEHFDLLYPSYGDSYPTFNGSVGMTYEQGGHSRAGRAIKLPNGDTLTLLDRLTHHKTTALSTIEVSSKNATSLVQNFNDYFKKSQTNPPGKYKTFIIRSTNHYTKIQALRKILDVHNIKYGLAGKTHKEINTIDYLSGKESKITVEENDLIISAYQPKGILTQVLFEPVVDLSDSLTYDITAWALPFAHGLEAFATTQRIDFSKPVPVVSAIVPKEFPSAYAYLLPWNSLHSAKFLGELLKNDVVVRYAEKEFSIEGKSYAPGTLVITRADNRKMANFDKKVQSLAPQMGVNDMTAVSSGLVSSGNDFGSGNMVMIEKPKVLVFSGERTSSNSFGGVWFFFEKELNYPITIMDADQVNSTRIKDFNVIIMPEGFYRFNDDAISRLSDWVDNGGKLIALGEANRALEEKKGFSLMKYAKSADKEEAKKQDEKMELDRRTAVYDDRERDALSFDIPGAIVHVKMDKTHPLAFGLKDYYASLKTNNLRYDLIKGTWNVGYLESDFRSTGFIGNKVRETLKNSVTFSVQNKGRGNVVYLFDNPLFRNFWQEGKLLFSNALFLIN
jgi:hypothetical protein